MGRKGAVSPPVLSRNASHLPFLAYLRWPFTIKRTAMMAVVLALLGIVTVALLRELRHDSAGRRARNHDPRQASQAGVHAGGEDYIQALWPIHGDVERSAARMTLGQIFYKINDMDRPSLKKRVDEALATYRRVRRATPGAPAAADGQARPPGVPRRDRAVPAVRHRSAQRCSTDGRDDHLMAAYPLEPESERQDPGGRREILANEFAPN